MIRPWFTLCAVLLSFALANARLTSLERSEQPSTRSLRTKAPRKPKFCSDPVAKAEVKFPEHLIGRAKHDFGMFSGYVPVTEQDWIFYWFAQAKQDKEDTPIIFWTNGGPGCTAMEGATTEVGPLVLFNIKEACSSDTCDYSGQLSTNPYSWNNHANIVFIDQPRNVGYSFGYGEGVHSSVDAGLDFVTFVNGWFKLFPEYANRKIYIAGESYGGHYLPAFAHAVMDHNEVSSTPINFGGLAIGNGCVNDTIQGNEDFVEFLHAENLIPEDSNPKTQTTAYTQMIRHIGYTPNYYDYRLQSVNCPACYGYNYTAWAHWFLQDDVEAALNVCGDAGVDAFEGNAGGCINVSPFDVNDKFDYSGALARVLDADIPVVFFYGKQDIACNYVGGLHMADTIAWKGQKEFAAKELEPLMFNGAQAGEHKSHGKLSWIQIEAAGHMVPLDQPVAAAYALQELLKH